MDIGSHIAELREERGWTQEHLASLLGISRAALSHYEKNRREPDYDTLTKFADLFKVSIDYLVGRTNRPTVTLDDPVREFVDQLELSDAEILEKFSLTIDGQKLTPEEARRFIAFVRAERNIETK
ncbi:helix-turn-helix domain-containing protein [Paenibacillus abyssi]|uniref:HTH-type transcriptional regulator Xre n=1 Tax=Paenibacillus abyssi TaxID=1340531 RepID=A0A917G417_9BACL|nr:helix-turn-helix transcriptional regulator [Paenibacillus abyssi]GGG21783.1 HTH-type transcriptional regulator Xre [Paenibacillus abyssi]